MSLVNYSKPTDVFLVSGNTDLRKGIDGLAGIVRYEYDLDVYDNALFLFCGRRRDRFKMLYWDGDGFMLLYKRIEEGKLQWPREDVPSILKLSDQQLRWLLEGLNINQKRVIHQATPGQF